MSADESALKEQFPGWETEELTQEAQESMQRFEEDAYLNLSKDPSSGRVTLTLGDEAGEVDQLLEDLTPEDQELILKEAEQQGVDLEKLADLMEKVNRVRGGQHGEGEDSELEALEREFLNMDFDASPTQTEGMDPSSRESLADRKGRRAGEEMESFEDYMQSREVQNLMSGRKGKDRGGAAAGPDGWKDEILKAAKKTKKTKSKRRK